MEHLEQYISYRTSSRSPIPRFSIFFSSLKIKKEKKRMKKKKKKKKKGRQMDPAADYIQAS